MYLSYFYAYFIVIDSFMNNTHKVIQAANKQEELYSVKTFKQFHYVVLAQCWNETLIRQIISSWCRGEQVQGLAERRPVASLPDIINVILSAAADQV